VSHLDGPINVLVVDDEPETAEMTATFLQRAEDGLVASVETDPTTVLGRLDAGTFDCVLSEYSMSGVDGLELLATVRDAHPELPFVLFTAEGSEGVASEAISAGVTDYVPKGAGADKYAELAEEIRAMVDGGRRGPVRERAPPR